MDKRPSQEQLKRYLRARRRDDVSPPQQNMVICNTLRIRSKEKSTNLEPQQQRKVGEDCEQLGKILLPQLASISSSSKLVSSSKNLSKNIFVSKLSNLNKNKSLKRLSTQINRD